MTEEQVSAAKRQIKGEYILQYRDITNQATLLGYNQITAGNYRHTSRLLAAIDKVSAADVQRVAKKYLNPNNRTVGFLQPTQRTKQATSPRDVEYHTVGDENADNAEKCQQSY